MNVMKDSTVMIIIANLISLIKLNKHNISILSERSAIPNPLKSTFIASAFVLE